MIAVIAGAVSVVDTHRRITCNMHAVQVGMMQDEAYSEAPTNRIPPKSVCAPNPQSFQGGSSNCTLHTTHCNHHHSGVSIGAVESLLTSSAIACETVTVTMRVGAIKCSLVNASTHTHVTQTCLREIKMT